jgi:hypothetical protein
VAVEPDPKPTIEALEEERRRLKELERNLAAERNRVQEAAAVEISRMQAALRDAADRAGKRERELETTQRKLERRGQGRRLAFFGAAATVESGREQALAEREHQVHERERAVEAAALELENEAARLRQLETSLAESRKGVEHAEALAAGEAELEARRAELDRQLEELVEVERRSAELLAGRAAELEAESAELRAREEAVEAERTSLVERAAAPPAGAAVPLVVPVDLRPEQERVEAKARTLEEAENRLAGSRAEVAAREVALERAEQTAAEERFALDARARELAELDDRATLLDAREAGLADSLATLERREQELAALRSELESEQDRVAGRARRLAEAERRAAVQHRSSVPAVTFSEGIRGLSRRRAG